MAKKPAFWADFEKKVPASSINRVFQVQMRIPEEPSKDQCKGEKTEIEQSMPVNGGASVGLSASGRPVRAAAMAKMKCHTPQCEYFPNESGYCSTCLAALDDGDGYMEHKPVTRSRMLSSVAGMLLTRRK